LALPAPLAWRASLELNPKPAPLVLPELNPKPAPLGALTAPNHRPADRARKTLGTASDRLE
jgi:hypothetical protein